MVKATGMETKTFMSYHKAKDNVLHSPVSDSSNECWKFTGAYHSRIPSSVNKKVTLRLALIVIEYYCISSIHTENKSETIW